jgi:hypothetical protein
MSELDALFAGLPTRTRHVLEDFARRESVTTIERLLDVGQRFGKPGWTGYPYGLGPVGLKALEDVLAKRGLRFGRQPAWWRETLNELT